MIYYQYLFQHYFNTGIFFFTIAVFASILPLNQISTQSTLTKSIDFEVKNVTIADAILELSDVAQLSIVFNSHLFSPQQKVTLSVKNKAVESILNDCLKGTNVDFRKKDKRIILFKKQLEHFTINGYIEDENSGERLIAAAVWDADTGIGTTTNEYGFFNLLLPRGDVALQFSYLGYQQKSKNLNLHHNNRLEIELKPSATLAEIIVTNKDTNNLNLQLVLGEGTVISPEDIIQAPSLVGEHDLLRYLKTQNGVQGDTDGFGGMYVRGGGSDQNLILLDDVPVFNPSHALGLFSVFNTSMIKNIHFAKDGFSAKYGGRLSSVLTIRNKDGNTKKIVLDAETSLISTKITTEIPIIKNKSGLLISARRSNLDPLIKAISHISIKDSIGTTESNTNYFFYDFNMKFHSKLSKNDRIFLNFYIGKDDFSNSYKVADSYTDEFGVLNLYTSEDQEHIEWGNTIASFRWNRILGEKLFSNTTLTYSKYEYISQFEAKSLETTFENTGYQDYFFTNFYSVVRDAGIKTDFEYYLNNQHQLIFGAGLLFRNFEPGAITESLDFDDEVDFNLIQDSLIIVGVLFENLHDSLLFNATEFNYYIEDHYQISDQFRLLFGIHAAAFSSRQKTYFSVQPRLSAEWKLNSIFNTYLSVGKMTQFLHILTSSGQGLPDDLWVPSTDKVKPEQAWQASVTLAVAGKKGFGAKTSAYYKKMNHLIRYDDEITLPGLTEIDPLFWEDLIVVGKGSSYGFETQLQKTKGKIKADISYAYARSFRTFENFNKGKTFPFAFDRPHSLKINYSQKLGKKTTFNLAWHFSSGRSITLISSNSLFLIAASNSEDYTKISDINAHRLPHYHRLDIGFHFKFEREKTCHFLDVGVYNAYHQKNVNYEYWYNDEEFPEESYLEQEYGLPILPSISYRILLSGKK